MHLQQPQQEVMSSENRLGVWGGTVASCVGDVNVMFDSSVVAVFALLAHFIHLSAVMAPV